MPSRSRGRTSADSAGRRKLWEAQIPSQPAVRIQIPPGKELPQAAVLRFVASVDDDAAGDPGCFLSGEGLGEALEGGKVLPGRGLGGLDLYEDEIGAPLEDEVDLQLAAVAVEGEPRPVSAMEVSLGDLGSHPGLEEGSPQGVGRKLAGVLDVEEVRRQAGVIEVQLGRLDEPLPEIGEERRQAEDDVARFQHRQPGPRRGMGNAAVAGQ